MTTPQELSIARVKTRTPADALNKVDDIMAVFNMDLKGPNLTALEIGKKMAVWNKAGCVLVIIALASRLRKLEEECTCKNS